MARALMKVKQRIMVAKMETMAVVNDGGQSRLWPSASVPEGRERFGVVNVSLKKHKGVAGEC